MPSDNAAKEGRTRFGRWKREGRPVREAAMSKRRLRERWERVAATRLLSSKSHLFGEEAVVAQTPQHWMWSTNEDMLLVAQPIGRLSVRLTTLSGFLLEVFFQRSGKFGSGLQHSSAHRLPYRMLITNQSYIR